MAGSQLTRLPVLSSCEKRLPVGFVEIGVEGCRLRTRAGKTRSLGLSGDPHGCGTDICSLRWACEIIERSEQVRLRTDLIRALDAVL